MRKNRIRLSSILIVLLLCAALCVPAFAASGSQGNVSSVVESTWKAAAAQIAYTGLNLPHAREKPATSPENFRHLAGEGCQYKRETTYCEEHTKNV